MALQQITPQRKVVEKKGRKGGGGLGRAIGAVAGGIVGGVAGVAGGPAGIAQGAIGGASTGGGLGQAIGNRINPARAGSVTEEFEQQVQLSASQEARRSQELLAGLQAVQNEPGMGAFANPLAEGYIKSMTNLKRMG